MIYLLFCFIYLLAGITIVSLCDSIHKIGGREVKTSVRVLTVFIWPLTALTMLIGG